VFRHGLNHVTVAVFRDRQQVGTHVTLSPVRRMACMALWPETSNGNIMQVLSKKRPDPELA
jgi:hypothetical protein